jgi:tetratricopeptide (TPR) repeat protein
MTGDEFVEVLISAPDPPARRALLQEHAAFLQVDIVRALKERAKLLQGDDARQALVMGQIAEELADAMADDEARAVALWTQADAYNYLDENDSAVRCYERAAVFFGAADRPLEAARTCIGKVAALTSLGRTDEAQALAERSRDEFEHAGDMLSQAKIDMNLGNLHSHQGRYAQAVEYYRRATEAFQSLGDTIYSAINQVNQANALTELDDFRSAEEHYRRAKSVFEAAGLRTAVASVDHDLAFLQRLRGDYTEAFRTFERARDMFSDLDIQSNLAMTDLEESDLLLDLNMPEAALRLAEKAEQAFDKMNMPAERARAISNQGVALARLRKPDAAFPMLDQAHDLFAAQDNPAWMAHTDLQRAEVLRQAGQHSRARSLANRASQAYAKLGTKTKQAYAHILAANSFADSGDWSRALEALDEAQEALAGLSAPWLDQRIETCRGRVFEGLSNLAEAAEHYRRAAELIERITTALTADEHRTAFVADKLAPYEALVALQAASDPVEAFQWAERAKSRALIDFLAAGVRPRLRRGDENDVRRAERLQTLREQLHWHYARLTRGPDGDHNGAAPGPDTWAKIQELEREITALWRDLQARYSEELSIFRSRPLTLTEVQSCLPMRTALVEYFVARGKVTAFCVTRERALSYPAITSPENLNPLLESLALQFSKIGYGPDYFERHQAQLLKSTDGALDQLGRALLEPLKEELKEAEALVFVPHGPLHALPLHALRMADRYLVETHTISYAPSAAIFGYCCNKPKSAGDSLPFVGRPLLVGVPSQQAPLVADEIQALGAMLPEANVLLGKQATFDQVGKLVPHCGLLHLAAHGLFRPEAPLLSSIELADRWLAVQDIYDLDLSEAALVVLSACETGLGKDAGGDDLVGLVRGFLYAGTSSLIVNLWTIEDKSMTRLMTEFYGHWLKGVPKARALREAQLALLGEYRHPYYWAPLILVGHPE